MLKRKTIFSKMFVTYSIIFILSLLLFIGVFFYLFHLNLYKNYKAIFDHHYAQIEQQLRIGENDARSKNETAERLSHFLNQPGYLIYIVDHKGRQLFGPEPEENSGIISIPIKILQKVKAGESVSEGGFMDGELQYIITSPLPTDIDDIVSPSMVMIFHELNHEYKQVILMILFTALIAIIFAGVILWLMSKKISAPLREMSDIAGHYAKGDFSRAVTYKSDDEVGQLAKSFTYMAKELNDLENRRKQYISNVSHELRSPLTSIKGFIIALMDGTITENRRSHYYLLMKNETERMIKLVNDTLDMNQLEEGNRTLYRTEYNLKGQIEQIIHKFEPQLQNKELGIRFTSDEDYVVFADEARMEQVIVNLLQNAIQFSDENSHIDINLIKDGNMVNVFIQDYGVGIAEEQLDLIWRRFYKVDESRTNKTGAGLGLAIVKSILDLHGSEIDVKSELGKGTTFSFSLPLSES